MLRGVPGNPSLLTYMVVVKWELEDSLSTSDSTPALDLKMCIEQAL